MYLKVRVRASAKREAFGEVAEGKFAAAVKEPAAGNRANARVIELLAKHLGIPAKRIRIKSGHHAPSKLFEIV